MDEDAVAKQLRDLAPDMRGSARSRNSDDGSLNSSARHGIQALHAGRAIRTRGAN